MDSAGPTPGGKLRHDILIHTVLSVHPKHGSEVWFSKLSSNNIYQRHIFNLSTILTDTTLTHDKNTVKS